MSTFSFPFCRCHFQWGLMFEQDLEKVLPPTMGRIIKKALQIWKIKIILPMEKLVLQKSQTKEAFFSGH